MKRILVLTVAALAAAFVVLPAGAAAPGGAHTVYNAIPAPLPGNLPSLGGEAYAFGQLGDKVTLAGTDRRASTVIVTMSSWGCQAGHWYTGDCVTTPGSSFNVPITLNVYAAGAGNSVGALLATKTQTFAIPYRPSADTANCTGGRWYQASTATCFNGLATNIQFDLTSLGLTLPSTIIYGISYNTSHYGPSPIGESAACYASSGGCGYDSLNIALAPSVLVGSKPVPDSIYWDTQYGGNYCDGGAGGTGTFRIDAPTPGCDWAGYVPAVQISAFTVATNKDQCKNNGWQSLARADGSAFKNQGDCIQYANTGK